MRTRNARRLTICALAALFLVGVASPALADNWVFPTQKMRLSGTVELQFNSPTADSVSVHVFASTNPAVGSTTAWRVLGNATRNASGIWVLPFDTRTYPDQGNDGWGTVNIVAKAFKGGQQISDLYSGFHEIGNTWSARRVDQSPDVRLESGDTSLSWFDVRNIGTAEWGSFVHLGTSGPRDRASVFAHSTWLSGTRLANLDHVPVRQGEFARFTFRVTAPAVTSEQVFTEHFEPVADGHAWMGDYLGWPRQGIKYTVIPAAAPTVQFTTLPVRVVAGSPTAIAFRAADNLAVSTQSLDVGGRSQALERDPGDAAIWRAQVDTSALAPGHHQVVARAQDQGGRTAETSATLDVAPNATGSPARQVPPKSFGVIAGVFKRHVSHITVTRVAKGSRVTLICKSNCGRARTRRALARRGGRIRLSFTEGARPRLPAVVEVRVRIGGLTRFRTFRLARTGPKIVTEGCLSKSGQRSACAT